MEENKEMWRGQLARATRKLQRMNKQLFHLNELVVRKNRSITLSKEYRNYIKSHDEQLDEEATNHMNKKYPKRKND